MKRAVIIVLFFTLIMSVQVFAQHFDLPEPVYLGAEEELEVSIVYIPAVVAINFPDFADMAYLWGVDPGNAKEEIDFKSIAVLAAAASTDANAGLIPRRIRNNEYFMESVRLKGLADASYESGDYDASSYYASESLKYAQMSDDYVAIQLKIKEADDAIARAKNGIDWAVSEGFDKAFPAQFASGEALYAEALDARAAEDYDGAISASRRIMAMLEGADNIDLLRMREADNAIAQAKAEIDWAVSKGLDKTYPNQFSQSEVLYTEALDARDVGDYDGAISAARRVLALLAGIQDVPLLPAQYTVRTWSGERDCLWNIAGYSWVYGDPTRWRLLYEANRSKMPEADNPDLIVPGMVLDIPSISNEARLGAWQSGLPYPEL